jgi:DNA mismatch repair protein MutS
MEPAAHELSGCDLCQRPVRSPPTARRGRREQGTAGLFADLHLDQVVKALVAGREEYDLAPLFYAPLQRAAAVRYRQEVISDLEHPEVANCVRSFAERMRRVRSYLRGMRQLEVRYYQQGWFLDAADNYCAAVSGLREGLERSVIRAPGLKRFREYLSSYAASEDFLSRRRKALGLPLASAPHDRVASVRCPKPAPTM